MIAKAEYETNKHELEHIAVSRRNELADRLDHIETLPAAINVAQEVAETYYAEVIPRILLSLEEIGQRTAQHYNTELKLDLSADQLHKLLYETLEQLRTERYYGATLAEREAYNLNRLKNTVVRSAYVGRGLEVRKANMVKVFLERVPFGAHIHIDNRLFLSEAIRLEHTLAKRMAYQAGIELVRWTLSETHAQKDVCDDLATNIENPVAAYIKRYGPDINIKGVYLVEDCPLPPHPNCQCSLSLLTNRGFTRTKPNRPIHAIRALLWRLRHPR